VNNFKANIGIGKEKGDDFKGKHPSRCFYNSISNKFVTLGVIICPQHMIASEVM
jgi:hypothetical protein